MDAYPEELSYKHEVKLVVSDKFVKHCMSVTAESALAVNSFMVRRLKQETTP